VAVTVNVNGLTCAHQTSGGIATATLPDVCKTPPNSAPIPYPNIALAADLVAGTTTITVDGSPAAVQSSMFVRSTGDEAGALGGVISQVFAMEATFLSFSPTVLFEGQPACRLTDKMLMNKGNTVCMGGLVIAPVAVPSAAPPQSLEPKPPEEPALCRVDSLTVSCGHDDRAAVDLMWETLPVLQVISTRDSPDKVVTRLDGQCMHGNPECPILLISREPDGAWDAVPTPEGEYTLPPPVQLPTSGSQVLEIIERLLGDRAKLRDRYILRPMICDAMATAMTPVNAWTHLEVFHEAEVKGEMTIGYAHPAMDDPVATKGKTKIAYDRLATWKFGGSIEGRIGGQSFKFEANAADMKKNDPLPLFGGLIDLIGKSTYVFDSMKRFGGKAEGEIIWPEVKFSAGLELVELPGKPLVGPKGNFKVTFEPLIGYQLKVSILDWLILFAGSIAPGPGTALARALLYIKEYFKPDSKERQEQGKKARVSLDMEIELTLRGEIKGGLGVNFVNGKGEVDGSASKVEGNIGVQLEGRLIGKAKVWRFEASGGGKLGLGGAAGSESCKFGALVKATVTKGNFKPDGEVFFTGLAVYYLLYAELAATGGESEKKAAADDEQPRRTPPPPAENQKKEADEPDPVKFSKTEMKGVCVLIQPWKWT
jgi:hypothetical protein